VHARGQVASHRGAPAAAPALNGVLPPDVRVIESEAAPEAFDARRDARSRTYRYRVLARPAASPFETGLSLHWPRAAALEPLAACAALLPGRHDFTAFTPSQTDHVLFERDVVGAEWRRPASDLLELWIEAETFMRHMVRVLVGTMLDVAAGRRSVESFARLLEGRPRAEAGPTVAAHGLYLESVHY